MKRLLIPATALLLACGGPLEPADVVGVYDLVTVNGQNLPTDVSLPESESWTFRRGTLEMESGTFTLTLWITIHADGFHVPEMTEDRGLWILPESGGIRFTFTTGVVAEARAVDGRILMAYPNPFDDEVTTFGWH